MRSTRARSANSRGRTVIAAVIGGLVVALVLLAPQFADANPDHSAGDYFMFAKAAGDGGTTDPKAFEPACTNGSNDKQAEVSGSTSFFYGRIHSNADWANSGATNTFVNTPSPNPELTYGVNEPPECELQQNAGNYTGVGADGIGAGVPVNITGNGNALSTEGPYQIGEHGWPGNLGQFLNDSDGVTFGNDVTQVLPGAACQQGTSLMDTDTYTVTAADAGKVICNGTGLIKFGQQGLGTVGTPFRITMISHGPIEIQDSNLTLAPLSHGVLAWTDMRFSNNATAIKLSGQGINVVERSILFTPRSGQDVSGSDQATLCLQMIGQGALKAAGSTSYFGPLAPGCGVPAGVVTEIHADRSPGGNAHDNLGAGASAVKVGTPIHDKVTITSHTTPPSSITGLITVQRFDNGTCSAPSAATATFAAGTGYTAGTTVTIDDVLPFTPAVGVYSYLASYGGDSNKNMAAPGTCEGPVRVVDARISIAASDTNRAGEAHTFTITVEKNDGSGWSAAAGVVVSPSETGSGEITGQTCSAGTTAAGTCTVTVNSASPGSSTVNATATVSVAGVGIDVSTSGYGALSVSNVKTWVDARISIAQSGTNRVDDAHTFTVTVEKNDGSGWVAASGVTVSPSSSGVGSITGGTCSAATGTAGTCTVIVNSPTPGVTTVNATATVSVGGLSLPVNTAGVGAHTISNVKTWVDARISIAESGTNRVNVPHTFTVTVEKNDGTGWTAASGVTVTPSETGPGSITGGTCSAPTNAAGTCTVIVNSATPGVTTVNATATVSVGGLSLPVNTAGTGAHEISNVKTHVDARISIQENGVNRAGSPHTFTVTVEKNDGSGWAAASGVTVTPSASGAGSITGGTCSAPTSAAGTCTVIVNSATPGITTVHATATVAVGGLDLPVDSAGVGAHTISNVKTHVDARISIQQSGTNRAGSPHTFTVTVEKNDGSGSGWLPASGIVVTPSAAGVGSISSETCSTPGTDASGECTVTVNSATPGVTTVNATASVSVGGLSLPVDTAGIGAHDISNVKTHVDARLSIAESGTNRVGAPHTFTVTVEKHDGSAAGWVPAAGVTVAATETGVGSIAAETCSAGTGLDGTCTVTVNSSLPGITTVNATATVAVGVLNLPVDSTGVGAHEISNVKTHVDARISIGVDGTNKVGDPHTFTVTVEKNDGSAAGWVPAAGVVVTPTETGVGAISGQTCTTGTTAQGTCTVTVNSSASGTSTVHASGTVSVGGLDLEVNTNGVGAHQVSNTKTWADARITIAQSGTNKVGDPHTFTVTVEKNPGTGWVAAAGVTVTPSESGVGSISSQTCSAGTDSAGKCTITVNSSTPGSSTVDASATVTMGSVSIQVSTSGYGAHNVSNTKTWVDARISIVQSGTNQVGDPHTFTVTVEQNPGTGWVAAAGVVVAVSESGVGDITAQTCDDPGTDADGECTVTVNSLTAGTSTVHASATVGVSGVDIQVSTSGYGAHTVSNTKTWVDQGNTLLIIDEDSIDNGIHLNPTGGGIIPAGPSFFSKLDVNDDKPSVVQRDVLRYFADNPGKTITVKTGQTNDEGWFAPSCIPAKWLSGTSSTCLTGASRDTAIDRYVGLGGPTAIPLQSQLDKIPAVMPLRARGLVSLIGKTICAVVYDSDISINYPSSKLPFTNGNLQGETLGIVAFQVNAVRKLNGFSTSTLPEVQLTIRSTSSCGTWSLFNAPVPRSSSIPNDIDPLNLAGTGSNGYRQLLTHPGVELFF